MVTYIGIDRVTFSAGAPAYSVGGTVTGYTGSGLVLWLNGMVTRAVAADGAFTFADKQLDDGTFYSVTVMTQPANQTCVVTNGAGTVADAHVERRRHLHGRPLSRVDVSSASTAASSCRLSRI